MTFTSDWTTTVGDAWAAEWRRTDRSFAGLAPNLDAAIRAAAPTSDATIVDIGCGAGATSISVATAFPGARVIGIDVSPTLVMVARERGAHCANLSFRDDGIEVALPELAPVDLLVSRHGVMFFADPGAVFRSLRAATATGGRFVFSCFRSPLENPWATRLATAATAQPPQLATGYAPGPFGFADPAFVAAMLANSGWTDIRSEPVDYFYVAGTGADPVGDARDFFLRIGPAASLIRLAGEADRTAMVARITAMLGGCVTRGEVAFPATAWIWSARAA